MGMDCIDSVSPVIQGAPVWIENREVEGRITWREFNTQEKETNQVMETYCPLAREN